jgi:RNA-binding protein Musashi
MYDLCIIKVLGIPWDVDTEGLREYMAKFGPLDDCVVMKV